MLGRKKGKGVGGSRRGNCPRIHQEDLSKQLLAPVWHGWHWYLATCNCSCSDTSESEDEDGNVASIDGQDINIDEMEIVYRVKVPMENEESDYNFESDLLVDGDLASGRTETSQGVLPIQDDHSLRII